MSNHQCFSVLMSVYNGESEGNFFECLLSLENQTLLPTEVVIVLDGFVREELVNVTYKFTKLNIQLVKLNENVGLACALNEGLKYCSYDLVARMDSDDICNVNRFEKQIGFLARNNNVGIVGSYITEFGSDIDDKLSERKTPIDNDAILAYAKTRCPVNHVTLVFRRDLLINAGGYKNFRGIEDYPLWCELLLNGVRFHNIGESLVFVRTGNGMISRRHGFKYAIMEMRMMRYIYNIGFLSFLEFYLYSSLRFVIRLLPQNILSELYVKLLRS